MSSGGYKSIHSGTDSSPNRSVAATDLTDLDSIQTLSLEEVDASTPGAARGASAVAPVSPSSSSSSGERRKHEGGGGGGGGGGHHRGAGAEHHGGQQHKQHHRNGKEEDDGGGCLGGLKQMGHHKKHGHHGHHQGRAPRLPAIPVPAHAPGGSIIQPAGANPNLIISGHEDLQTLYATNDVDTGPITVNVCNAPNSSTIQCGCENINCPFCNLMLSIEKTDPTVLQ